MQFEMSHFVEGDDMHNLPEEQGSVLFRLLTYPDGVPFENLSTDALQVFVTMGFIDKPV